MLSVVVQEHKEGNPFIQKMIQQVSALPSPVELIFVTSAMHFEFVEMYNIPFTNFPIRIVENIHNPGDGRNEGGRAAIGDTVLFLDCHTCFTPRAIMGIKSFCDSHPNDVIAPSLQAVSFPECTLDSPTIAYGVAFTFRDTPFEWTWISPESYVIPTVVPMVCACAFMIKKRVFDEILQYGGFLAPRLGVGMEEEIFMRLARLGHKTYIDPINHVGHLYKGYPGKPQWDSHSTAGYYIPRIASIYVNVFDPNLWDHITTLMKNKWGQEWDKNIGYITEKYGYIRKKMEPFANRIDERWYFRV